MQKNKNKEEPVKEASKFCLGLCDHEFLYDDQGRPYIKCHGCGRLIGKAT